MNLSQHHNHQAYIAALFAVFIWGAFPALMKDALTFTSVDEVLTLRFLVSTLLFLIIIPRTLSKLRQIRVGSLMMFVVASITVFYSQAYALSEVPASWYVAVFTFVPIIFIFISREPLNSTGKMGSLIAIAGMCIFFLSMRHMADMTIWHIVLLIISMLAWVGYSLSTKQLHHHLQDLEIVALTSLVGLLSSLLIWKAHGFHPEHIPFSGMVLCLSAGIILPLALIAYSFSLRFKPVFAVFSQYLEPVIGFIISAIFLGESMHFLQYTAAMIVIAGTVLVGMATKSN